MSLIILPCAGGSSFSYNKYTSLDENIKVYEYPGHWSKIDETFDESFDEMVLHMVEDVALSLRGRRISILGHSMGALVGWKAIEIFQSKNIEVEHLYVAACCCPAKAYGFFRKNKTDEDIEEFLRLVYPVQDKMLKSSFFMNNLMPAIRHDFELVRKQEFDKKYVKRVDVPITCLCGNGDPLVSMNDGVEWKNFTTSMFGIYEYPGNHFFLNDINNAKEIIDMIKKKR